MTDEVKIRGKKDLGKEFEALKKALIKKNVLTEQNIKDEKN